MSVFMVMRINNVNKDDIDSDDVRRVAMTK